MTPEQIKLELFKRRTKVTQSSIARDLGVTPQAVANTINRKLSSERIRIAVAASIELPVEHVFPEYCQNRKTG